MNTDDLLAALSSANVEPGYRVRSVAAGNPPHGDYYYLDVLEDGRWVTGVFERGAYHPIRYFSAEDDACHYFYEMLTRPSPTPRVRSQQEIADDEEHMRRWRASQ